ncbi:MAG: hypothetical protein PHC75_07390 [Burkholderiales bacterium]|nr:hypothetical protein [Burkholderiales bacterium]
MKLNKLIFVIFSSVIYGTKVFADESDNQLFQSFDNSIGLGYSYTSMRAYNPDYSSNNITTNSSNLALHLERLFDNNIWMSIDGSFAFKASQSGQDWAGFSTNTQSFGFPASISAKGGYSFNWSNIGLQVIPYAQLGRELNYNGFAISNDNFSGSYLNQYALGGRLEYIFLPEASIYLDQSIGYLQDPNGGDASTNQSAMNYTTLLGIKYNATNYFQISAQGMFSQTNLINSNQIGYEPLSYDWRNTSQSTFGGMLMFSYLYNNDQLLSKFTGNSSVSPSAKYLTTMFDNSYSFGMGFLSSNNHYSSGNNPSINSKVNYFNFNVTHEFENSVWAQINAQLMNSITQDNIPAGRVNASTPTYIGFPGNVTTNAGYAFHGNDNFTVIPYGDLGVIMNMNSYNVRNNSSITNAISKDMYLQYGAGAKVEYAFNDMWQIYADQLLASMYDMSSLNINAWRSTTSVGAVINPYSLLQVGVKGFYDSVNPTGNTFDPQSNSFIPANQNSLGLQFDIGLRY